MKKAKTTLKDLEIKFAVTEQHFADIRRRLDLIELNIEKLAAVINRGLGAWKGLLFLTSLASAAVAILKQM